MLNTHCVERPGNGSSHRQAPAKKAAKKSQVVCPYCLEPDEVIPIFYGYPTHASFLRAERGEIYLGGSIGGPTSHYCKRDDREF